MSHAPSFSMIAAEEEKIFRFDVVVRYVSTVPSKSDLGKSDVHKPPSDVPLLFPSFTIVWESLGGHSCSGLTSSNISSAIANIFALADETWRLWIFLIILGVSSLVITLLEHSSGTSAGHVKSSTQTLDSFIGFCCVFFLTSLIRNYIQALAIAVRYQKI